LPRMARLIEEMVRIRKTRNASGELVLDFPHRILDDPEEHVSWPSTNFSLQKLYPQHPVFARSDVIAMQAELEAALGAVERLHEQVDILTRRLHKIPGYTLAARFRKTLQR